MNPTPELPPLAPNEVVTWVRVEREAGDLDLQTGRAVVIRRGERVRYSTPESEGAEYIAVCLPAFSPQTVHRDE